VTSLLPMGKTAAGYLGAVVDTSPSVSLLVWM